MRRQAVQEGDDSGVTFLGTRPAKRQTAGDLDDSTGRKRFKGMLLGLDGNDVVIEVEASRLKFPFRANLALVSHAEERLKTEKDCLCCA